MFLIQIEMPLTICMNSFKFLRFSSACIHYTIRIKIRFVKFRHSTYTGWLCTQQTFVYSKSTIKPLKKVWNMFTVNNKDIKTTSCGHLVVFIINYVTPFSIVFTADFKQVKVFSGNLGWNVICKRSSIKYIRENFRKTNISNLLIRT